METSRLTLRKTDVNDSAFIFELVNTPAWLKFIGDRNVKSVEEARGFIQKINENPNMTYWVISLKNRLLPLGIISFLNRDYLEHYDIGFALLPRHEGMGYAYEAAKHVLQIESQKKLHQKILAVTVSSNEKSIRLIAKLGLKFKDTLTRGHEELSVYST